MAVSITEKAAVKVKSIMADQKTDPSAFLRIVAAAGGCSGFSYQLNIDTQYDPAADIKYDCHGVAVVVDKKAELYLDGTVVDYYDGLEKSGFTFNNPTAVKTCGCGSSFSV